MKNLYYLDFEWNQSKLIWIHRFFFKAPYIQKTKDDACIGTWKEWRMQWSDFESREQRSTSLTRDLGAHQPSGRAYPENSRGTNSIFQIITKSSSAVSDAFEVRHYAFCSITVSLQSWRQIFLHFASFIFIFFKIYTFQTSIHVIDCLHPRAVKECFSWLRLLEGCAKKQNNANLWT